MFGLWSSYFKAPFPQHRFFPNALGNQKNSHVDPSKCIIPLVPLLWNTLLWLKFFKPFIYSLPRTVTAALSCYQSGRFEAGFQLLCIVYIVVYNSCSHFAYPVIHELIQYSSKYVVISGSIHCGWGAQENFWRKWHGFTAAVYDGGEWSKGQNFI